MSRLFDRDAMVAAARELCTALLRGSEPYGCFRWKDQPLPNLLYLNDVVMLCWVIDDLPADPELRSRWRLRSTGSRTRKRSRDVPAAPTDIRRSSRQAGSMRP